ncbi:MAG: hypothetical protein QM802_22260 [Agriterribacter sp.]
MKANSYTIAFMILLVFSCLYILQKFPNKKTTVIKDPADPIADG